MSELPHPPHEMFAHFIAFGNHPVSAAVAAGYPRDPDMAKALLRQPRIAARIAELAPIFANIRRPKRQPPIQLEEYNAQT